AAELADSGVTANAVSPGSTATPILDESARLYRLPGAEAFAGQQPAGRLLDPAEMAAVLGFLARPASAGRAPARRPRARGQRRGPRAGGAGARAAGGLPAGFGVVIDPGTKQLDPDTLFGGAPARVLRLSRAGRTALAELRAGPVRSAAAGRLARKLTDAGL